MTTSHARIYTVGDGRRHQWAMREDGTWFVRTRWRGHWSKWRDVGTKRPFEFGMYLVPNLGKAHLPPMKGNEDDET